MFRAESGRKLRKSVTYKLNKYISQPIEPLAIWAWACFSLTHSHEYKQRFQASQYYKYVYYIIITYQYIHLLETLK